LLPLFSVSANAVTVDGYNITTAYWYDNIENMVEFSGQIKTQSSYDKLHIAINITYPSPVKKNLFHNLELSFDSSAFSSISCTYLALFDDEGSLIDTYDADIIGNVLSLKGVEVNKPVSRCLIYLDISYPRWKQVPVEYDMSIDGYNYPFQGGMTWQDFIDSSYNVLGLVVDEGKVYRDNFQYKLTYNSNIVSATDLIVSNGSYFLEELGSVATTITFYVNFYPLGQTATSPSFSQTYNAESGMTWQEWVDSEYNIDGYYYKYVNGNYYIYTMFNRPVTNNRGSSILATDAILHNTYYKSTFSNSDLANYLLYNYYYDFSVTSFSIIEADEQGFWDNLMDNLNSIPEKISNKIQGLFVPDQNKIIEIGDKFEALLKNRFGAAYEAYEVVDNFAAAFVFTEAKESISIPSVTVNLAGSDFTFGGWTVNLIPNGFEGVVDSLKLVGNIVCTVAFLNGVRKRYSEVIHDAR
jgi:hypothetical protein